MLGDRLTDNKDRFWMLENIKEVVRLSFGANFDLIFKHCDTDNDGKITSLDEFRLNLFGDVLATYGLDMRPYEELLDREAMIKAANKALDSYNEMA